MSIYQEVFMKKANIRNGILIAAAAVAALIFSSCMRMQLNTELKENGTASIGVTYGLSTTDYPNAEEAIKEDAEDHEITHFTVDGKEYVGYSYSEDVKSYEEFEAALMGLKELDDITDTKEPFFSEVHATRKGIFKKRFEFSAKTNVIGRTSADNAKRVDEVIKIDFTLTMPGKITDFGGGTLTPDGKTIIFSVDPQISNEYHATSDMISVTNIIIVIAVIAAAAIGVLLYFSYKEKAKPKLFLENMPGTVSPAAPDAPRPSDNGTDKDNDPGI